MEIWLIIGVIVVLVLLRIFFKLAKFALILGILIIIGIVLWNMFVNTTA
jgi:hypothetical protein